MGWFNARKKHWQSALRASPLTNWRVRRIKIMGLRHGGTLWATRRGNVVRATKNAKLQTICCSANLHSGYAVSLGVTQLALQRHEVPETHKNYRHAYGAYRQHDDHAWSAFTGSGFFCGFNDAAFGLSALASGTPRFFGRQILNVSRSWEVPPRRKACPLLAHSGHAVRKPHMSAFGG